jgi:hypothetical protein
VLFRHGVILARPPFSGLSTQLVGRIARRPEPAPRKRPTEADTEPMSSEIARSAYDRSGGLFEELAGERPPELAEQEAQVGAARDRHPPVARD